MEMLLVEATVLFSPKTSMYFLSELPTNLTFQLNKLTWEKERPNEPTKRPHARVRAVGARQDVISYKSSRKCSRLSFINDLPALNYEMDTDLTKHRNEYFMIRAH